jgi:two-component sensor histidine kinase/tetratricopeptide (TPR) repeat protein
MKALLLTLFIVCAPLQSLIFAQTKLDSLKVKLAQSTSPQERAVLVSNIGELFFSSSRYDSLTWYAAELLDLSKKLNNRELRLLATTFRAQSLLRGDSARYFSEAKAALLECESSNYVLGVAINCLGIGSKLLTIGKYDQCIVYLLKGFDAIDEFAEPKLLGIKSDLIRTVSSVYHHQGKYSESLDFALRASILAERSRVPMQILKSYLSLGGLYGELSSPENGLGTGSDRSRYHIEAKKYMRLGYQFSLKNASKLTQGATAFNLGSLYAEDQQKDSALHYLNEALRLGIQTGYQELLSNAYRMKSTLYSGQPDSAIYYLDLAFEHSIKAKNPITGVATSLDKAKILVNQKKWREAENLTLSALERAKELKLLNDQRSAYFVLYQTKTGQRAYKDALEYYVKFSATKDSIVSEKNFARIEELKTKYETELKDSEIEALEQKSVLQSLEIKQKSFWLLATILTTLLTAFILFLYVRQRTLRQKQKALSIKNRFLRFQLDPHFLSNALVSIQRFMMDNNTAQASNYLTKFSRLMRQLLEYSREELITIEEEIDLLRNYLDIQKLRLKDKFEYEIKIDKNLSVSESNIQPMFAQPFVENAIEHGVGDSGNGKIEISFSLLNDQLVLEIKDNGKGLALEPTANSQSLSTKIIRERIALLNKTNKKPILLTIGNVDSGTGTRVQVTLPIYS